MPETFSSTWTVDTSAGVQAVEKAINYLANKDVRIRLNAGAFTQPLGQISSAANEFNKSLEAANARVLAFGASAGILFKIQEGFRKIIENTIEVEKTLTNINVILGLSGSELGRFGDSLFKIASQTGNTFREVGKAALELSRQGLGAEETLKRTRDALVLTRLSGLEAAESVEAITAALNGFDKTALTSTEIINKLANVDAAFSVSSRDLAEALKRSASVAQDAGVSFDQLIGLITAAQQTTQRGGSVIGNALKTIFTRLENSDTIKKLQDLGVAINNTQSGTEKLQVLSQAIQSLNVSNPTQADFIKRLVGGVYQINIVTAALADLNKEYSVYSRATEISNSATDQAIQRNQKLNQTLSAFVNDTLSQLTQKSANLGQFTFEPLIRRILDFVSQVGSIVPDKESQDLGSKIGRGIFEGIGKILSGPALAALAPILGLLAQKFVAFAQVAAGSLKNQFLLSIGESGAQQLKIQEQIQKIIGGNPEIYKQILLSNTTRQEQEQTILSLLKQEVQVLNQIKTTAATLSPNLFSQGVRFKPAKGLYISEASQVERAVSSGFIPSYMENKERMGAYEGGYVPGEVRERHMPGLGRVIYNDRETIKDFGLSQPAIMPPEYSQAGTQYKKKFQEIYEIDPYRSKGNIPNFSELSDFNRIPAMSTPGHFSEPIMGFREGLKVDVGRYMRFLTNVKGLSDAEALSFITNNFHNDYREFGSFKMKDNAFAGKIPNFNQKLVPNFAKYSPSPYINPVFSQEEDFDLIQKVTSPGQIFEQKLFKLLKGQKPKFKFGIDQDILKDYAGAEQNLLGIYNSDSSTPIQLSRMYSRLAPAFDIKQTLTHEVGHQLDDFGKNFYGKPYSKQSDFLEALERDKSKFGDYLNKLVGISVDYPSDEESFAELINRYTNNLPFSFENLSQQRRLISFKDIESLTALKDLGAINFSKGLIPNYNIKIPTIQSEAMNTGMFSFKYPEISSDRYEDYISFLKTYKGKSQSEAEDYITNIQHRFARDIDFDTNVKSTYGSSKRPGIFNKGLIPNFARFDNLFNKEADVFGYKLDTKRYLKDFETGLPGEYKKYLKFIESEKIAKLLKNNELLTGEDDLPIPFFHGTYYPEQKNFEPRIKPTYFTPDLRNLLNNFPRPRLFSGLVKDVKFAPGYVLRNKDVGSSFFDEDEVEKLQKANVGGIFGNYSGVKGFPEIVLNQPENNFLKINTLYAKDYNKIANRLPIRRAKGLIPNFSPQINQEQLRQLLKSKKFQSLTYAKSKGETANYNAAQFHVRRDLLKGAPAPAGYEDWSSFDEATNSLVLYNQKEGEEERKFRRFTLSKIKQVRAEGDIYDVLESSDGLIPNFVGIGGLLPLLKTVPDVASLLIKNRGGLQELFKTGQIPQQTAANVLGFIKEFPERIKSQSALETTKNLTKLIFSSQKSREALAGNLAKNLSLSSFGISTASELAGIKGEMGYRYLGNLEIEPQLADFAFRSYFGSDVSKHPALEFLKQNRNKSFSIENDQFKNNIAFAINYEKNQRTLNDDPSKNIVPVLPGVLGRFNARTIEKQSKKLGYYKDTFDFDLHDYEKEQLSKFFKTGEYPEYDMYSYTNSSEDQIQSFILRDIVSALKTNPVTFSGLVNLGDGLRTKRYLGGDVFNKGLVPNFVSPNFKYALGYGKFRQNFLGLNDLFKDPIGTVQKLPFRIAGSLGAGAVGLATRLLKPNDLEHEQYFSAARYLSGLGGVRNVNVAETQLNNLPNNFVDYLLSGGLGKERAYHTPISQNLFNVIGDFNYSNIGKPIQDAFDFDHSQLRFSDESKEFSGNIDVGNENSLLNKITKKIYSSIGKPTSLTKVRHKINFGPIETERSLNDNYISVSGLDTEFAKYGSPFLTRVHLPKFKTLQQQTQPQVSEEDDLPFNKGLIPNFVKVSRSDISKKFQLIEPRGTELDPGLKSRMSFYKYPEEKTFEVGYVESKQKGDARAMFTKLAEFAKKRDYKIVSHEISPQWNATENSIYKVFPQLKYRQGLGGKTSLKTYDPLKNSSRNFSDISDFENFVKYEYEGRIRDLEISNLITTFFNGKIPNFAGAGRFINLNSPFSNKPPGLNLEEFRNIGGLQEKNDYLDQLAMQQKIGILGMGSARKVFDIGENFALKMAHAQEYEKGDFRKGLLQNQIEANPIFDEYRDIVPFVNEVGKDFSYLISEKAQPYNEKIFQQLTDLIHPGAIESYINNKDSDPSYDDNASQNSFVKRAIQLFRDKRLNLVPDINDPANIGLGLRGGQISPLLIDIGYDKNAEKFYHGNQASKGKIPNFDNIFTNQKYDKGLIPNYNKYIGYGSPLEKSVKREESAGIPTALIRVGQNERLRGPENPLGLGVYNTKDEPGGLWDGILRAEKQGINPQIHGIPQYNKGLIPNFADEGQPKLESPTFGSSILEKYLLPLFNDLKTSVIANKTKYDEATKTLSGLIESFNLTTNSAKSLQAKLKYAEEILRPGTLKTALEAGEERKPTINFPVYPTFPPEKKIAGLLTEGTKGKNPILLPENIGVANALSASPTKLITDLSTKRKIQPEIEETPTTITSILQNLASKRRTQQQGLQFVAEGILQQGPKQENILAQDFDPRLKANLAGNQRFTQLERQSILARRLAENAQSRGLRNINPTENLQNLQTERESILVGPNRLQQQQLNKFPLGNFNPLNNDAILTGAATEITKSLFNKEKIEEIRRKSEENLEDLGRKAQDIFGIRYRSKLKEIADGTGENADFAKKILSATKQNISNKLQGFGIGLSIGAPVITSVAQELIGDKTRDARVTGASIGAVGEGLSFAGLGAQFGTYGLAIGSIVGAGVGLVKIIKAFNDNLPELQKDLELSSNKLRDLNDGFGLLVTSLDKYQSALTDTSGKVSATDIVRRQNEVTTALLKIPEEFRSKIAAAAGDAERIREVFGDIQRDLQKTTTAKAVGVDLTKQIQDIRGFLGGNLFGQEPEQKTRLTEFSKSIFSPELLDIKKLREAGGENILENIKSAAVGGNSTDLNRALNQAGVPNSLNEVIEKINKNPEDAKQFGLALAALVNEFIRGKSELDFVTESQKRNTEAITKFKVTFAELTKSIELNSITLEGLTQRASRRVLGRNELLFGQSSGLRQVQLARSEGALNLARPFLNDTSINSLDFSIKAARVSSEKLNSIEQQLVKSQNEFNDLIGNELNKSFKELVTIKTGVEPGGSLGTEQQLRSKILEPRIQRLSEAFGDVLRNTAANTKSGVPPNLTNIIDELKQTLTPEELTNILSRIENISAEAGVNIAKILQESENQTKILDLQKDIQEKTIIQQQRLNFGGGAQGFLAGNQLQSRLSEILRNSVAATGLRNQNFRTQEVGRGAFQISDILKNTFNLKNSPELAGIAAAGRSKELEKNLNLAESVSNIFGSNPQLQEVFKKTREEIPQIAQDQIANQLKIEELPSVVENIRDEIVELNKLLSGQQAELEDKNRKAFEDALKNVHLDNVTKDLEIINTTILKTSLLNQKLQQETTKVQLTNKIETTKREQERLGANTSQIGKDTISLFIDSLNAETKKNPKFDSLGLTNELKGIRELFHEGNINFNPEEGFKKLSEFTQKNVQTIPKSSLFLGALPGNASIQRQNITGVIPQSAVPDLTKLKTSVESFRSLSQINKTTIDETNEKLDELSDESSLLEVKFKDLKETIGSVNQIDFSKGIKDIKDGARPFNEILKGVFSTFKVSSGTKVTGTPATSAQNIRSPDVIRAEFNERFIKAFKEASKSSIDFQNSIKQAVSELNKIKLEEVESSLRNAQLEFARIKKDATAFTNEVNAANDAVDELKIRLGELKIPDVGTAFLNRFNYTNKDFFRDFRNGAVETADTIKSSFADAFNSFAQGTEKAGAAFRKFALSVASKITTKTIDIATSTLFNSLLGSAGPTVASLFRSTKAEGGYVNRYASGGKVIGGSGVRDDVPALLSEGEYVIKRSSAQKYGDSLLKMINGGQVPQNFSVNLKNQYDFTGPDSTHPIGGKINVDPQLSVFALTDTDNPQNQIRLSREEELFKYLQDKKAYDQQKNDAIKLFNRQKRQALQAAYIAAAINIGGASVSQLGGSSGTYGGEALGRSKTDARGLEPAGNTDYGVRIRNQGGIINKFGLGGYTYDGRVAHFNYGGRTQDNIPALLTGGEVVINKPTVDKYGVDFFNRVNKGLIPTSSMRRYATGGLVGQDNAGQFVNNNDNTQTSINDSLLKLIEINQTINDSISSLNNNRTNTAPINAQQPGNGGIVNNFSINIQIDQAGNTKSNVTGGQTQSENKNNDQNQQTDESQYKKFAENIKNEVIKVIIKEKKPGGLLTQSS